MANLTLQNVQVSISSINTKSKQWSTMATIQRGDPKNMEFIYKTLCIYSYMFKLQSPSKYSAFDVKQLLGHFTHCSK